MTRTASRPAPTLHRDHRATTSLEMALVLPIFLFFVFGMFACYSLIISRRAMDYGIEKALRYGAVNGGGGTTGTSAVVSAFATYAGNIVPAVGAGAVVTIGVNGTPSATLAAFKAGDTLTVAVSYAWSPSTGVVGPGNTSYFTPVTLSASASMRVVN